VGSCEHGNEPYALLNGTTCLRPVENDRASGCASFLSYRTCTDYSHILRFDISHFSSDNIRKGRLARATDGTVLSIASRDKSKDAVPEFDAQMMAHILYLQK
jgi:hypothetical protein